MMSYVLGAVLITGTAGYAAFRVRRWLDRQAFLLASARFLSGHRKDSRPGRARRAAGRAGRVLPPVALVAGWRAGGQVRAWVVGKAPALSAPANPLPASQLDRLGGSTINVPADVTLGQLAEMRAATSLPIDLYVEAPSAMGGVVRGQEAADLVAVAAPMYVKFGLRNSRLLYPSGLHLVEEAAAIAREKVHRARVALEWMGRSGLDLVQSRPGAPGLGVPEP